MEFSTIYESPLPQTPSPPGGSAPGAPRCALASLGLATRGSPSNGETLAAPRLVPLSPQGYALNPLPPLGVDQFSIAEWLSFRLPLPALYLRSPSTTFDNISELHGVTVSVGGGRHHFEGVLRV